MDLGCGSGSFFKAFIEILHQSPESAPERVLLLGVDLHKGMSTDSVGCLVESKYI